MVNVSEALVKVRGQPLSDGAFVRALTFCGFGASGSDCWALVALISSETTSIEDPKKHAAAAATLRIRMGFPANAMLRNSSLFFGGHKRTTASCTLSGILRPLVFETQL